MQAYGQIHDGVIQVVAMMREFGREERPGFETGESMLDNNASLRDGAIVRLLLVGERGYGISFGFARALVRDVQVQGLERIGKAQLAQIKPNLAAGKPAKFAPKGHPKLAFEEPIIILPAPDRMTEKQKLALQGAEHGVFHGILMLFATRAFFERWPFADAGCDALGHQSPGLRCRQRRLPVVQGWQRPVWVRRSSRLTPATAQPGACPVCD